MRSDQPPQTKSKLIIGRNCYEISHSRANNYVAILLKLKLQEPTFALCNALRFSLPIMKSLEVVTIADWNPFILLKERGGFEKELCYKLWRRVKDETNRGKDDGNGNAFKLNALTTVIVISTDVTHVLAQWSIENDQCPCKGLEAPYEATHLGLWMKVALSRENSWVWRHVVEMTWH